MAWLYACQERIAMYYGGGYMWIYLGSEAFIIKKI